MIVKNFSYGLHSSLAAILQRPFHVQEIYSVAARQDKRMQQLLNEASIQGIAHRFVSKDEIEKICGAVNHQGVVVVYKPQQTNNETELLNYCAKAQQPLLLLVLDQIVDPHNLGACMRSAAAASANAVICCARKSASLTPAVRKVACGAAEHLPLITAKNLARYINELKQFGIWVYGTQPTAQKLIYEADFCRSVALVIGAESAGLRRLTAASCDELLRLPMANDEASLNASVAAGVALFEAVRQRQSG